MTIRVILMTMWHAYLCEETANSAANYSTILPAITCQKTIFSPIMFKVFIKILK